MFIKIEIIIINTNEIVKTSNLKCIFSFDCGLTWKSYDFYNTAFLNIDDIELTNESVSDINLQDKVINYGIDASKLKEYMLRNGQERFREYPFKNIK